MKAIAEHAHSLNCSTKDNGVVVHTRTQDRSHSTSKEPVALQEYQSARDYHFQDEAVDATIDYFVQKKGKHPLIVLPTGAGKSHVLGKFVQRVLTLWADQKILVITHREKLIEQDHAAISRYWRQDQVGMYSAGLGLRQRRRVCVAGIQSIWRKPELFDHYTVILVDEAHMIPPGSRGQYRTFLGAFPCPVIGLTATHFRLGSGYLHTGKDRLFDGIAYECDMLSLIEQGYLCKLVPRPTDANMDTDGLHTQSGDFVKNEMVNRFDKASVTAPIIKDLMKYKDVCKKWLLFAIDIDHCEHVAQAIRDEGITAQTVHSRLSKDERIVAHDMYSRGHIQALVSVETLTTGFDDPDIDLIGLVRPTKSPVLHIQMIGRGLRTSPNKEYCTVLDYAGNIARLGPINDVHVQDPKKRKKGKGQPIVKTCPVCSAENHGAAVRCHVCDYIFPRDTHLQTEAGKEEIVSLKKKAKGWPRMYDVDYVSLSTPIAGMVRINFRCSDGNTFYKQGQEAVLCGEADSVYNSPPKRIKVKRLPYYPWKEVIDYEYG